MTIKITEKTEITIEMKCIVGERSLSMTKARAKELYDKLGEVLGKPVNQWTTSGPTVEEYVERLAGLFDPEDKENKGSRLPKKCKCGKEIPLNEIICVNCPLELRIKGE